MLALLLHLVAEPSLAQAMPADCPDYASDPGLLAALEPHASRGALEDAEKACLDARYAAATVQTTKDKISRVMMVNAYAYDTREWSRLVQRHLDEVDRSDPDIAYLYAYHLYNTDPGRAEEAIGWTEVALERKDVWKGKVFVSRVYGLMRLRAIAAADQWKHAEEALVRGVGTADEVDRLRNEAKTFAREWVDMARGAGRSPQDAFDLCITMASAQACGLEQ